jgi:hypothetical protein
VFSCPSASPFSWWDTNVNRTLGANNIVGGGRDVWGISETTLFSLGYNDWGAASAGGARGLGGDVDIFGVHLLSLPGYFNRQFLQSGACHYDPDDVTALATYAKAIAARGETVVLTSHGPPMGRGPGALDRTPDDEHVGDPQLNTLLEQGDIRFGIFSHILEAGGRAVTDIAGAQPVVVSTKKPMKTPVGRLYVNVGSASSFGWGMNDGTTSRGLSAVVTVDGSSGGSGRVVFLPLR